MGLGIQAGSNAIFITTDLDDEQACTIAVTAPDYPERLDGFPEGIYEFKGEIILFTIGRYSYYDAWRALLCRVILGIDPAVLWADPAAFVGQPFVELVNFSDQEGAIGPRTSQKLAQDFANYVDRLPDLLSNGWEESIVTRAAFLELFQQFQYAFELASHNGFLIFE